MFLGILFYRLGFLTVQDNDKTPHVASYEQSTLQAKVFPTESAGVSFYTVTSNLYQDLRGKLINS
jgi:hypothetical protein